MSSVNSSVRQEIRQHSQVYCHCHLKCVVYTCYRGLNRGKQFYRCIHNRTDDDCNFFKWINELEEPSLDTHYAWRGIDEKV
ncbi:hypothetical protein MA16_Dca013353 [Dendrobium catenatum]|uniref:GRF-type domain-containing protein n=1 Tax=Dendrobium catenatum TaxID=906689 RepID=A0A2I0VIS3_9ASPA|nr:hypothetical protein MA16_Dca013353 [Dendrobium catenatum]